MKIIFRIFLFILTFNLIFAEEKKEGFFDGIKFSGLADILPYFDGRDFSNKTYMQSFTSSKFRLGAEKWLNEDVGFKINFQDSRVWGQEGTPTSYIANVDLIEGYVTLKNILNTPLSLQAGRFQMNYSNSRFIGTSPWSYVERSFDGLRFKLGNDAGYIDGFYTINSANIGKQNRDALVSIYNYPSVPETAYGIYGFWGYYKLNDNHAINAFGFLEQNEKKSDSVNFDLQRFNVGFDYSGQFDKFSLSTEFGYQFGKEKKKDIAAYLVSINLDYNLSPFKISIGSDINSGTDPKDKSTKVNTYYSELGSKHKFFGTMDYFTKIKEATDSLGINDFYLGAVYREKNNPFEARLTGHYFMSNKKSSTDKSEFGKEIDILLRYYIAPKTYVEWSGGVFMQGDLMKDIWIIRNKDGSIKATREDLGLMTYFRIWLEF